MAELTSPPLGKNFNTGVHLSLKSMALNSCSLVAWAENKLCPVEVTVVHVFLTVRGIVTQVGQALLAAGKDPELYSSYSFRIGAVSTATKTTWKTH